MELRVLKYFLTVVNEESITRASEVLHITQPTLSRQLAQLEDDIGVKLFERGSRKITLTNEGILLRRRAEEILQLVSKTKKEMSEQEKIVDGEISIGCGELASVQTIAEIIKSFQQKYPLVRYDIHTANADHIRERLDKGLTDIGLLLEPVDIDKYEFIRMNIKEKWGVIMRPDDPLTEKESVTPEDLSELPVCIVKRSLIKNELASWFGDYFKKLNIRFTSNMSTNASVMVTNGLAYALVLEGSLPYLDTAKICYRPLCPELITTSVIAWKRHQPQSLATEKFIEHIRNYMSQNN
ncbi:MAG: LysR family transcriptional regulator [Ruminococcus sp.]|nr:LysR family transcriptional regulator [Ruminococcus sp.]